MHDCISGRAQARSGHAAAPRHIYPARVSFIFCPVAPHAAAPLCQGMRAAPLSALGSSACQGNQILHAMRGSELIPETNPASAEAHHVILAESPICMCVEMPSVFRTTCSLARPHASRTGLAQKHFARLQRHAQRVDLVDDLGNGDRLQAARAAAAPSTPAASAHTLAAAYQARRPLPAGTILSCLSFSGRLGPAAHGCLGRPMPRLPWPCPDWQFVPLSMASVVFGAL